MMREKMVAAILQHCPNKSVGHHDDCFDNVIVGKNDEVIVLDHHQRCKKKKTISIAS